jgi:hypothetical protein
MPFTTAHIAAILPLTKFVPHYLSLTGLIIGSMVPDFEYFIRMTLLGHYGHTFGGIFFFDIPIGMILYILYHGLVRQAVITHLPPYFYKRASHLLFFDWKFHFKSYYFTIIFSIFIGTLTHFIWDGFTHDEEYILARYLRILLVKISILGYYYIPLYSLLQILSSFIGMILVFGAIDRQVVNPLIQKKTTQIIYYFWIKVLIISLLIGIARCSIGIPNEKLMGQLIVVTISSFMFGLLVVSIQNNIK